MGCSSTVVRKVLGVMLTGTLMAVVAGCDTAGDAVAPSVNLTGSPAAAIDANRLSEGYTGTLSALPRSYEPLPAGHQPCTIGWLSPVEAQESIKMVGEGVIAQAEKLGCRVIVTDAKLSVNQQVSNVYQLISQGVDAIVYYPLDANALTPALTEATGKNIAVVGLEATEDRGATRTAGTTTQVWHGLDLAAYQQVKAVQQVKPGARVGLVGIGPPVPPLQYMVQREKYWAQQLGLTVVAQQDNASDDTNGGEKAGAALFAAHPDLDAVLAYNDSSAFGVYSAAQNYGLRDLIIVGCNGGSDAADAVARGRETMSLKLDSVGMGKQAALGAYRAIQGEPVPDVVVTAPQPVTAGNVAQYTSWAQDLETLKAAK
jgi:ribose transport system substrate-binding protein